MVSSISNDRANFERRSMEILIDLSMNFSNTLSFGFSVPEAIRALNDYWSIAFQASCLELNTAFDAIRPAGGGVGYEAGMNSPGILWDRLTILICRLSLASKESKHYVAGYHDGLGDVRSSLASVLTVLNLSLPTNQTLLAKEQTLRVVRAGRIGVALGGLMRANLGMWINQDLLYTNDPFNASCERLRDYIGFFGTFNRDRNKAIEEIELIYRTKLEGR